jgi:hypothetical protein
MFHMILQRDVLADTQSEGIVGWRHVNRGPLPL